MSDWKPSEYSKGASEEEQRVVYERETPDGTFAWFYDIGEGVAGMGPFQSAEAAMKAADQHQAPE